ncbi:MAG TPA: tetrahydrofolate dehydrogenase/cyclohydrolase catalytic domain-containing protein [Candidatus Methylacidiphilales bacterium]|jgi:methylenetetrahydrofolate dehydrogenase (NADP+)/methenyltetrahydrofolate cyclohydrolase|nr:tetrahydrofolate dehydrogenase/cyclohydrolase catalytic domain-containing protein [Candidatus Methylacidiphilales bacterium]
MSTARLIDGKAISAQIHSETKARTETLRARGITPGITFVRVGEDPASRAYVRMKGQKAEELGIKSDTIVLEEKTTQTELLALIEKLNANPAVHGILVQAPLPKHIHEDEIFSAIDYRKDVDGFHPVNVGKLLLGQNPLFKPCTPAGVHELLIRTNVPTAGAEVVILGRGNIVGKPMAAILLQKDKHADATVTLLHSRSKNIGEHCRRADILIAAMGQAHFVKADMVKPGAVVIDVGVNRVDDPSAKNGYRLVGDVDFAAVSQVAGAITPNPGGVGPMTIAMLLANTVRAAGG